MDEITDTKITHALVLAGGRGERLRPLTDVTPKPLLDVCGKPITHWQIEMLKANGIKNIILSVGYMADKIKEAIGNGERFGVNISYVVEDEPLGTAGPLWLLRTQNNLPRSTFVMCNGDELKDINISKMLEAHKRNSALATIALTEIDDPRDWGVVRLINDRITEFVEKPTLEQAPSRMINSGFYIIEPEIAAMVPPRKTSLEREIFPQIVQQDKLYGFHFQGQWFPTDTPERITRAEANWTTKF
jgi:NDP-sugar pyrophosphorylase family protein